MLNVGEILLNSALATLTLAIIFILLKNKYIYKVNAIKFSAQCSVALLGAAFLWLIYSFYVSDFSLLLVYDNSHTLKPSLYKITGAWGNHEGSFLMFISILSVVNWLITRDKLFNKSDVMFYTLIFNTIILLFIVLYSRFTSNPFAEIFPVPDNGRGLNPLLQDIGLAIHPPILYIGYVCMSVVFSASVAALWLKKMPPEWVSFTKKWALSGLAFLTLGIGMGSWWAYRELGWGGFWFWDPVENSSLLPWLSALAFSHAVLVFEKRKTLQCWTLFLGILTFSLSLAGFFLVRSGVLSSVHSFASDPMRGLFILLIAAVVVGFALFLFSARSAIFATKSNYALYSREGAILINNLLLVILCATVFVGTIYPILLQTISGQHVSVGAPYFNTLFNPIACGLLVFAAIAPALMWKEDTLPKTLLRERFSVVAFVLVFAFMVSYTDELHVVASFAVAGAFFLFASIGRMIYARAHAHRSAKNKPLSQFFAPRFCGMLLAHAGFGLLALSIAICSIGQVDVETQINKGESFDIAGHTVTLKNISEGVAKNYLYERGEFGVRFKNNSYTHLYPERRVYPVEGDVTTESALHYGSFADIYLVIGEEMKDGKRAVRAYFRPMVSWIWLSCCLMTAGLLWSLGGYMNLRRKIRKA